MIKRITAIWCPIDFMFRFKLYLAIVLPLVLILGVPSVLMPQSLSGIDLKWIEGRERSSKWGKDPFDMPMEKPEGSKVENESRMNPLSLSAIIYREGKGIAIINNKIMRVGEITDGMEITRIMEDRVILRGPRGVKELKVKKFVLER